MKRHEWYRPDIGFVFFGRSLGFRDDICLEIGFGKRRNPPDGELPWRWNFYFRFPSLRIHYQWRRPAFYWSHIKHDPPHVDDL